MHGTVHYGVRAESLGQLLVIRWLEILSIVLTCSALRVQDVLPNVDC